ncbi:16S rRNA processing protein RimM [Helicobacter monodelphidis]|uniref:ribosome maturation factor RimM n=1 Tax=Helicobacter sp. 15-1451 TaxID=2004995 RepID=UPI000DCF2B5F|nr:ribosome maturation factor RimM [Helicobacter sp. 15-1451]RAX58447.1 16S rRNA processing protein RimM [Helicobacter sp. 15-1451]
MSQKVIVGKIGRSVGLKGAMKLYLLGDFPDVILSGRSFFCNRQSVVIQQYDSKQSLIFFENITTPEMARVFVGHFLSCSEEQTRQWCALQEGQFFWFEIIGASVIESNETLGEVVEIERIGDIDYLVIQTHQDLQKKGEPSRFMLPYTERFIVQTTRVVGCPECIKIITQGAKDILQAS